MRDEQQAVAWQLPPQPLVVERGQDGLARSGGGDDEVAHVPTRPLGGEVLEDLLLVLLRLDLELQVGRERLPLGALHRLVELLGHVRPEDGGVARVLLEGRRELLEDRAVVAAERRTFHSSPSSIASAERFDEPTYPVEKPVARWNSQALACRRVCAVSYETRTSAPISCRARRGARRGRG